ncbi:DEAD/DEAH box helicase [Gramella sp. AN32]|uniref:DEAD/DEAH box helicase n=1 Tax=Christiangramia antarctica TaxID=2058158 RepID=A0ABW5X504_9FLAO|nr:DEAD/DEAH box helicase [Gramella sp. AN32]MCM4156183.1 DEAD/DEAH box helicase [Gramella sp. AN32]
MLSLQQAIEIKESILAYLKATFSFQDRRVHKAFYDFVNDEQNGMFKGPYLSLKLPFVTAAEAERKEIPLEIKPDWPPYDHQVKSWHRLSTEKKPPQPTIITTGTGSGKTESFMYPVLDYCYKNQNRQGIKVIILYPMNALATDQAKRLAEAIFEDERLKGKITAGLFLGEGENSASYPKSMGTDHIIENRGSIIDSPPDILLTNFKMLDYGLMKSGYQELWTGNLKDSNLLQFLVLDELHTYDGAQGTDVANLIRRLKLKIKIPQDHLCAVGTSATIGSGKEAPGLLADYASKIFGEKITEECVITENRLSSEEFFGNDEDLRLFIPEVENLNSLKPIANEGYEKYLERLLKAWGLSLSNLASELKDLKIVKDLVAVTNEGAGLHTLSEINQRLNSVNKEFRKVPQWDEEFRFNPKEILVQSLFSLISEAKVGEKKKSPFLFTQAQIWIRELSGILREMQTEPSFTWKDEKDEDERLALPPWFCRECGASGWIGIKHDNKERFEKDVQDTYSKFFENHKHIYFANLTEWFSSLDAANAGYEASNQFRKFVYNRNLEFYDDEDEGRVDITAFRKLTNSGYNDHVCPECNTRNTVSIIGTRTATLSSIGVSQILSTDLDNQDEKQRKVLAFTNSVQDAAHQAGFVEARNYRFTFRSSLQKVLNSQGEPKNLKEVADLFKDFWKKNADQSGNKPIDAYYYRFYPTDYLGKSNPEDYKENKRYDAHFQKEFDHRMDWEVFSEFGYNSLIGRTLEKTGSSAVYFDSQSIEEVWEKLKPWLDKNEPSGTIKKDEFITFVHLILHRIRSRGAINHPYLEKFRTGNLKRWDLNWMKDSRHFLNRQFGPQTRMPKPVTFQKEGRGILDSTYSQSTNWFHVYYKKSFQQSNNHADYLNDFYEKLLIALNETGVLDRKESKEISNFVLNPEKIYVNTKVFDLGCNKCGHNLHTSDPKLTAEGGECLIYRCNGKYSAILNDDNLNYYQMVYNRNRSPRIYAADHTGLLAREKREKLEIDFKCRPDFNSKNAMVATSTLEMGIDIGTLNTAFNNSVPPMPSNFLQRVGRAGRASGSALLVNFAQSKSHDLFYYREPLDMMAGEVSTPGCYLEAMEILKRHFFAYCLDSWASEKPKENKIPPRISILKLHTTDLNSREFFLNRILHFIKVNEKTLFEDFVSCYRRDIKLEVIDELKAYLENEQFYSFHRKIFPKLKEEILFIEEKRKEVFARIEELNLGKEDPELIELENEKKNLGGIIRSIKNRLTLEHLTNIGALPNYAFPETGVTLNAKVLGNKPEGSDKFPLSEEFEIVRAASIAIREFAPDNHFYSQGYKFKITGVNTFDWSDKGNFYDKRFCSNCDHIERADLNKTKCCPKCGHPSWGASSNIHKYAKLLSVKSFNNKSDASINDSKDERDQENYTILKHFNFKDSISGGAWAMKEVPFGIEYVKNVTITDSNLGRSDIGSSRKIKINDLDVPAHGFITCRHCGKSSSHIHQKDYKQHYGYCKYKEETYDGKSNDIFEEVFFFREVKTEALKILLPIQDFNSEAEIKMFRSGIELGLKKYFKGNPQHIMLSDYREYNQRTSKFDRYLILYDTIPGGTGYLEKLFDLAVFNEVLQQAYEGIANCTCQHQGKDGCYRCIYSYSNQYYQTELSRERAEKRFESIIKKKASWENFPSGLGNITNKGQIEESELEERFIRSFRILGNNNEDWEFGRHNQDGIINYSLKYSKGEDVIHYHIRPQVDLGNVDGVEYHTRCDFLFICTYCKVSGKEVDALETIPKTAIYLDGYQFHASKENNRFLNDFQKRAAITRSAEYQTWTLSWEDLDRFDESFLKEKDQENRADFLEQILREDGYKDSRKLLLQSKPLGLLNVHLAQNNFERFLEVLKYPLVDSKYLKSWAFYLGMFQKKLFSPSYSPNDVEAALTQEKFDEYCKSNRTLDGLVVFSGMPKNALLNLAAVVNIQRNEVLASLSFLDTEEINKDDWTHFWTLYNLLQFYDLKDETLGTEEEKYSLEDLLGVFEEELHPYLIEIFDRGEVKNEEDEIRLNNLFEQGKVKAEAELIIHNSKQVINPNSLEDEQVFIKKGFEIIKI